MFKSLKKKKEQDNNVYNGFDHNLTLITKLFRDIENSTLCEIAEITNEEIEVVRAYRNKIKPDSPKYQEPYYAKDVKQMLEKICLYQSRLKFGLIKLLTSI
jgi:hypothetical protein